MLLFQGQNLASVLKILYSKYLLFLQYDKLKVWKFLKVFIKQTNVRIE